jgi:exoribonuclease R
MTTTYKVVIHDRNSTKWTYYDFDNFKEVELSFAPLEKELFSNDVFSLDKGNVTIVKSSIRSCTDIPGILVLKNNRTYGRNESGKLLYKCIPDDTRLPCFLIPYDTKQTGFSKVLENRYITFQFHHWSKQFAFGILKQNLGSLAELPSYYEYQLYCKSLNASIQSFQLEASKALKKREKDMDLMIKDMQTKYKLEDRTSWKHIFTIDPVGSVDFDDAVSLQKDTLSIYISNVSIWMETLNLWNHFSRRISTIYLPDKKRPMLPTLLSDGLCSLQEGNTRFALTMDIVFDSLTMEIKEIRYINASIRVSKNYRYEEESLLNDEKYKDLFDFVLKIHKTYCYLPRIKDSHDLIAYLMILMNHKTAQRMKEFNNGLFRSVSLNPNPFDIPSDIPEDVAQRLKLWNQSAAEYVNISNDASCSLSHDVLKMDAYIHITSPIRRLVDLLNLIQIQKNERLWESKEMEEFYKRWTEKEDIEYINRTMRSVRRVQNDCCLLKHCTENPEVMSCLYKGYVFDKMSRRDELYQYTVYLPDLSMMSRIVTRDDLENYGVYSFQLYFFENEEKMKKKIRIQRIP